MQPVGLRAGAFPRDCKEKEDRSLARIVAGTWHAAWASDHHPSLALSVQAIPVHQQSNAKYPTVTCMHACMLGCLLAC